MRDLQNGFDDAADTKECEVNVGCNSPFVMAEVCKSEEEGGGQERTVRDGAGEKEGCGGGGRHALFTASLRGKRRVG